MSRRRVAVALFLAVLAFSAAADDGPLFKIYQQYVAAIEKSDLAEAKKYVSSGKQKDLEGKSDAEALAAINVISPKEKLRQYKEIVDGDDATLIVRAFVAENDSVGRIELARENGAWKILSELWDIGGDPEVPPVEPGLQPKNEEQRAAIRRLRERGYPAPSTDFMVMSAVSGELENLKLFLQAGYPPDSKSDDGSPAIVGAASFHHPEVVIYLIEAGADVNAVDGANTTALIRIADKCDTTEAVQALLKAGARTDIKSAGGATALQMAEWSECKDNADAIRAAK